MSCFMMDAAALATLAEGLEKVLNMGFDVFGFEAPETLMNALVKARIDRYGFFEAEKIYDALYALNAFAYAERYRGERAGEIPPYPEKVKGLLSRPGWDEGRYVVTPEHYQFAKLLDCLIYQCSEGKAMKTGLYQGLIELKRRIYVFLVQNTPEWKDAPWGEV